MDEEIKKLQLDYMYLRLNLGKILRHMTMDDDTLYRLNTELDQFGFNMNVAWEGRTCPLTKTE